MPQLTIDDVIAHALVELDLETKIMLLTGAATFSLHGNEAIGVRPMILSDGPTGVRGSVTMVSRSSLDCSGSGSAARSILPLGVSGNSSRRTKAEGTM